MHPHKKWQIGIGIILGIFFMFSASLLGIGVRLRTDAGATLTMAGYLAQNCTLDAVQVVACPTGGYVAVWRRKETGFSVLADPFSLQPTQERALLRANDYPLSTSGGGNGSATTTTTVPCMCNTAYANPYPVINCKFFDACMLNVPMVEYMQKVGIPFGYAADTLIAVGSLTLVLFLLGFVFLFLGNGLCDWCCCCSRQEKEMFYVIGNENEGQKD
jgi:hypothetical protein